MALVAGEMFKKCLGIRTLIKSSVELDQPILHYIAYDLESGEYEVTIIAQAQTSMMPFWHFKIMMPYALLDRFMKYIFKLISICDAREAKKPKSTIYTGHEHNQSSIILPGGAKNG